jgi:hypothetical protein
VQVQLGHFADVIAPRIKLDGPKLHLNAAAAQAIGPALHELAIDVHNVDEQCSPAATMPLANIGVRSHRVA